MNDNNMRFYYHATVTPPLASPELCEEIKADVAILGAGFTGLSTALELASYGLKVVILEAKQIGAGASGRNGGHICSSYTKGMDVVEAKLGKDKAKIAWEIIDQAPKLVAQRVKDYDIECEIQWGYLHAAAKPRHMEGLKSMCDEWDRYGYHDHKMISKPDLEARLESKVYHGAAWEGGSGHLHPLKYCYGLAKAAMAKGVIIHENSPVTQVITGKKPSLITQKGRVNADFLVLAGNAYMQPPLKQISPYLIPIGSYMMATKPLDAEVANRLIKGREAVADTNIVLDYYRLSEDNRLIFGGRATYSGLEPSNLEEFIHRRMRRVFPQLSHIPAEYVWGGKIGLTVDRLPHYGRIENTSYFAQGYCGHGVAFSQITGKLIAQAIHGQAAHFDLLSEFKHFPFPGGPLRQMVLSLGMLYYRLRDQIG